MTDLSERQPVNLDKETAQQLAAWAEELGGSIVGQIRRLVRQEQARRDEMYNSIREYADALPSKE